MAEDGPNKDATPQGRRPLPFIEPSSPTAKAITRLLTKGWELHLKTVDLCFLVALFARMRGGGAFDDESLVDCFEGICEAADPVADNPRKRATHSIQRLRDQRILTRVDKAGAQAAGDFALTALGVHVAEFLTRDDALTRETLRELTKSLIRSLSELVVKARAMPAPEVWRDEIALPLRITIGELIGGIERRQLGLDEQQEATQSLIDEILRVEWFKAVSRCEALLEETATTLNELHRILLEDAARMHQLLHEIGEAAAACGSAETLAVIEKTADQIDHVSGWSVSREGAWSAYYQDVTRFLRETVRLDPHRALSHKLRESIAAWPDAPYSLVCASQEPIEVFRTELLAPPPAVVEEPHVERNQALEETDLPPDDLDEMVDAALADEPPTLSVAVRAVLERVDAQKHFLSVGRITGRVAKAVRPQIEHRPPWRDVDEAIEIEEWTLLWPRRRT